MLLPTICPGCGASCPGRCQRCAAELPAGDLAHDGLPRRLVLGLKYRNARAVAALLAEHLVDSLGSDADVVDVVTWPPTSARHVAERGYDPAELIARAVARRIGKPCRRLLRRSRSSAPQRGKDRAARLVGPQFSARPMLRPRRVLLVDDVTTTGATLRRAAEALVAAGALRVTCIAGTRTR